LLFAAALRVNRPGLALDAIVAVAYSGTPLPSYPLPNKGIIGVHGGPQVMSDRHETYHTIDGVTKESDATWLVAAFFLIGLLALGFAMVGQF
jgi:hypothetical protein